MRFGPLKMAGWLLQICGITQGSRRPLVMILQTTLNSISRTPNTLERSFGTRVTKVDVRVKGLGLEGAGRA